MSTVDSLILLDNYLVKWKSDHGIVGTKGIRSEKIEAASKHRTGIGTCGKAKGRGIYKLV